MTELSYLGVPSILVPYPYAADDHQTKNAEVFHEAGAGVMMTEDELEGEQFLKSVKGCLDDPAKLDAVKNAARGLAVDDAAAQICAVLEK